MRNPNSEGRSRPPSRTACRLAPLAFVFVALGRNKPLALGGERACRLRPPPPAAPNPHPPRLRRRSPAARTKPRCPLLADPLPAAMTEVLSLPHFLGNLRPRSRAPIRAESRCRLGSLAIFLLQGRTFLRGLGGSTLYLARPCLLSRGSLGIRVR